MIRLLNGLILLFGLGLITSCWPHHPDSPHSTNSGLYLPADLEATLWAESPLFYNPTNMDVDVHGRIWITEAVNYRNFNNDSTRFMHHAQGDRVIILQDIDQDGHADTSLTFVQDTDLVAPLGIAVLGKKVYVSCAPHLIVYTDENGDDKPDHKEIILTGFGGVDHDHSLHAVIGGPDGRLYFNSGNAGPHTVTDKSGWTLRSGSIYTGGSPYNLHNEGNRVSDDGRIWVGGLALRLNPDGSGLKVLAHNFRNAYELTVDSYGNLWQNDNDDQVVACRTTWLMEGGNAGFFSSDGTRYWQADQRPWQDVFSAHWHQDDPGVMPAGDNTGAGSPTGIVVNEGDALGPDYRGMLFSAEAGRNVIFGYHPAIQGSGYALGVRQNFITSLKADNPGYVWNDSAQNAATEKWFRPSDVCLGTDGAIYIADWYDPVVGGHQMQDTTGYGRIYRVKPKGKKLINPTLDLTTIPGLIVALQNPAINVRHQAAVLLRQQQQEALKPVAELLNSSNPFIQARALWLLADMGQDGQAMVKDVLTTHREPALRATALRALRPAILSTPDLWADLARDTSAFVRRELLQALTNQPITTSWPVIKTLIAAGTMDRWYLEAIGQLLEAHADTLYPELKSLFDMTNLRAEDWPQSLADLTWRLHPPSAIPDLMARINSSKLTGSQITQALTALAFIHTPSAAEQMLQLTNHADAQIADQAKYWLAFRQSNDWHQLLDWKTVKLNPALERQIAAMRVKRNRLLDEKQSFNERKWNAQDMARDTIGANMLIALAAEARLPDTLYPAISRIIFNNPSQTVRLQASRYFAGDNGSTRLDLNTIAGMNGDAPRGKNVFMQKCNACHRWQGQGLDIGPDLYFIGQKLDKPALLDAIVYPDAAIVFGYEPWLVQLKNGASHLGFILAEGADYLTIKDVSNTHQRLPVRDISSRKALSTSLMPSASSLQLSPQDLADITDFLLKTPPKPSY